MRDLVRFKIFVCLFLCFACSANGEDQGRDFVRQLRSRGLFQLAERYCRDELSSPRITNKGRIELSIELSDTLIDHASIAVEGERDQYWIEAEKVLTELCSQYPDEPGIILPKVSLAMLPSRRCLWTRQLLELTPNDEKLRSQGLNLGEQAIERLSQLDQPIKAAIRSSKSAVETLEYRRLDVERILASVTTRIEMGLLQDKGSADRASSLIEAEKELRSIAGGVFIEDRSVEIEVLLIRTARLRGELPKARKMVDRLKSNLLPSGTQVPADLIYESAQLHLEQGFPDRGAEEIQEYRALTPELSILKLEIWIVMRQLALDKKSEELADQLQEQIEKQVEEITENLGGYWEQRALVLVTGDAEREEYGPELGEAVRIAREFYQAGKTAEAAQAYQQAVELAQQKGSTEHAVSLEFQRGSILLAAGTFKEAAEAFHNLREQYPEHAKAPDAWLLEAYALGELYRERATKSRREVFTQTLEELRSAHPKHSVYGEACWLEGVHEEGRLQFTRALELFGEIPLEHPRHEVALSSSARCYEKILNRIALHDLEPGDWPDRAKSALDKMLPSGNYTATQAEIAIRLARIHLKSNNPDYKQAEDLLKRVSSSLPTVGNGTESVEEEDTNREQKEAPWPAIEKDLQLLRVVSLAGTSDSESARQLLESLSASPDQLLAVLTGINRLIEEGGEWPNHELALLQIRSAEKLNETRGELTEKQQLILDQCLAEGYVALGRVKESMEIYKTLVRKNPELKSQAATNLMSLKNQAGLEQALIWFRELEKSSKPGTEPWLEHRLNVAQCLVQSGRTNEARKLIKTTRVLYPKLGNPELAAEYEELEKGLQTP